MGEGWEEEEEEEEEESTSLLFRNPMSNSTPSINHCHIMVNHDDRNQTDDDIDNGDGENRVTSSLFKSRKKSLPKVPKKKSTKQGMVCWQLTALVSNILPNLMMWVVFSYGCEMFTTVIFMP